jgi:nitroimidazol reductase NimA-like FMN-containing flavoprotein (pyridoxamine 5'-phosphate oxidase superfamily)
MVNGSVDRDLRLWQAPVAKLQAGSMEYADRRFAPATFIRMDRAESLRLLASVAVGRLILTIGALPTVRPMNFAVMDDRIVLRTAADSAISRRVDQAVVAFEADQLDGETGTGWSVTVTGRAAQVTDAKAISRYQAGPLAPWAPGDREHFVTISTELVEGRRIVRAPG